MKWNWRNPDWPNFRYDTASLVPLEQKFLQSAGEGIGAARHFNEADSNQLRIELLSDEAVKTFFRISGSVKPCREKRRRS